MMKIAVILRLNPVLSEEIELTEDERDIDREWIGLDLNPFDDQALEQAVLLKESYGAHVTAIALEDEGSNRMLKTALARDADAVYQIPVDIDEEESRSSRRVASAYAEAIQEVKPDVVMVGVLSTDDVYGELAPHLAGHLGWSQVSAVSDVRIDENKVIVRQEYSGGRAALLSLTTPTVIGVQAATQPPRFVSGSRLRELLKVEVPDLALDLDLPDDASEDAQLALPDLEDGAEMLEGEPEDISEQLYQLLKEKGFV
ncbi:putative Electron transfer flavoprotein subunit beta [Vibrio nigripulchritudo MADA3029]|uniref:electron transfer flavoprotein subunit beta/FixA family protein n=2 Tax=Vibrio nigripulchritudo TaxID=28173 RepID=UPI0003B22188|nr:electron transfer flavoprotein subunit beta [Vibrio nigripulchritudo]CCN49241.1 putative Electron transfer flavoprotein subunit beta [Vibrio nigripulchritudo MADA3020]CCN54225.1 putative Electron transfer flavoprotein subunit beta [Vibrio nigripulchritudo MADA3021]CCN61296.1 putative Electron transfer flavoprotein subunit beta [Vibrio nigripulchritudo MADA3029]